MEMTAHTPATAEMEKWLRIRVRFSQIFDSGSERKTQNPARVDSGNADPVLPLVWRCCTLTSHVESLLGVKG